MKDAKINAVGNQLNLHAILYCFNHLNFAGTFGDDMRSFTPSSPYDWCEYRIDVAVTLLKTGDIRSAYPDEIWKRNKMVKR